MTRVRSCDECGVFYPRKELIEIPLSKDEAVEVCVDCTVSKTKLKCILQDVATKKNSKKDK